MVWSALNQRPERPVARKIIIDTDPGLDDAVAILVALASPEIQVLGISAVAGNVPLAQTGRNALIICELAGRPDVPVHAGCDAPLARRLVTAESAHGASGLDGIALRPPSTDLAPAHAVDFIIDTLRREVPGTVTLVAIGPLTNIATAFDRAPDIVGRLQEVVLMGGACFEAGNATPAAEFNIHVDPEAAAIVFASGVPLTVLPLDVTNKALTSRPWVEAVRGLGTRQGDAVAGWTCFYERSRKQSHRGDGAPLHDPCAVAWLIRPELFTGSRINVEIETQGRFTSGMTVADLRGVTGREPNCLFITDVDAPALFDLLLERLGRLGRAG